MSSEHRKIHNQCRAKTGFAAKGIVFGRWKGRADAVNPMGIMSGAVITW